MTRFDRRITLLLCLTALLPFLPGTKEFLQKGLPDILFAGDGAILELRVRQAVHGLQSVGPYSRFHWSHPGPLFFYLAAPFYLASGERGTAINLFVFVANACVVCGLVLTVRRLFGATTALAAAALVAVYGLVAVPFAFVNEWNPISPILAFAFLTLLAVRLARADTAALPLFAFLASVIVQTHIAFLPEVAVLCGVSALGRRFMSDDRHVVSGFRSLSTVVGSRTTLLLVLATCWALPIYDALTSDPGNLQQIARFFTSGRPAQHPWTPAFAAVGEQLQAMPVAFGTTLGMPGRWMAPSVTLAFSVGSVIGVVLALLSALRRQRRALAAFSAIVLIELVVAVFSVRAIRGPIETYLVLWISVIGLLGWIAIAAWALEDTPAVPPRGQVVAGIASMAVLLLAVRGPVARAPVFHEADPIAEQFARSIESSIRTQQLDRPTLRMATLERWPMAAAVALQLSKHGVPVAVDDDWLFMFGTPFVAATAGEHPAFLFGSAPFDTDARRRRDLTFVAREGDTSVYVDDGTYLRRHMVRAATNAASGTEISGDAGRAVDGIVPVQGSSWNAPEAVVLLTPLSALTVVVPRSDLAGVVLTVSGDDLYTIACDDGRRLGTVGVENAGDGTLGMFTRPVFADIGACPRIVVRASGGDGQYSVGEVAFLSN